MANFDSYLNVSVEDIKRPEAPVEGHYFADAIKWKTREVNYGEGKEKTPVVTVDFKITGPDGDAREAAESEGVDADKFTGRVVNRDYTLNEDGGQFGLRQLGEFACGVDVKGLRLSDMLDAVRGQPVLLYIDRRADKNNEGQFFPNVKKVLPATQ